MSSSVYPKDVLPEMGVTRFDRKKCCRTCGNTKVTNAGACSPGLQCRIADNLFMKKKIENGNAQVGEWQDVTVCNFWKEVLLPHQ